jgi:hypothetical protein
MILNHSPWAADAFVSLDAEGAESFVVVLRATFAWGPGGSLVPVAEQPPVRTEDAWSGKPGESAIDATCDLVPAKPRVDVLLEGRLKLPAQAKRAEIALQLGTRRKAATVFGDRVWLPGVMRALALSEPRPFDEMPFSWERSFGGADPQHPGCLERRNPAGRGMRKSAEAQLKQPAPNFEDPRRPISAWNDRPTPIGFGPLAPHWEPRVRLGGTYDERWRDGRFPLLPDDFDPGFHNCAPADQQLDAWQPGLEVRLEGMTPARVDVFRLPTLEVPVTFVNPRGRGATVLARPDTVIIDPAKGWLSVVARAVRLAQPDVYAIRQVIVGGPPAEGARDVAPALGAEGVTA